MVGRRKDYLTDQLTPFIEQCLDLTVGRYQVISSDPNMCREFVPIVTLDIDQLLRSILKHNFDTEADVKKKARALEEGGGEDAEDGEGEDAEELTKEEELHKLKHQYNMTKASELYLRSIATDMIKDFDTKNAEMSILRGTLERRDVMLKELRLAAIKEMVHLREMIRQFRTQGSCDLPDATFYNWDTDLAAEQEREEQQQKIEEALHEQKQKMDHERETLETRHAKVCEDLKRQIAHLEVQVQQLSADKPVIKKSEEGSQTEAAEFTDMEVQTDKVPTPPSYSLSPPPNQDTPLTTGVVPSLLEEALPNVSLPSGGGGHTPTPSIRAGSVGSSSFLGGVVGDTPVQELIGESNNSGRRDSPLHGSTMTRPVDHGSNPGSPRDVVRPTKTNSKGVMSSAGSSSKPNSKPSKPGKDTGTDSSSSGAMLSPRPKVDTSRKPSSNLSSVTHSPFTTGPLGGSVGPGSPTFDGGLAAALQAQEKLRKDAEQDNNSLKDELSRIKAQLGAVRKKVAEKEAECAQLRSVTVDSSEVKLRQEESVVVRKLNVELRDKEQVLQAKSEELRLLQDETARWFANYRKSQPGDQAPINYDTLRKLNTAVNQAEGCEESYRTSSWKLLVQIQRQQLCLQKQKDDCDVYAADRNYPALQQAEHRLDIMESHSRRRVLRIRHQRQHAKSEANRLWDTVLYYARSMAHGDQTLDPPPYYAINQVPGESPTRSHEPDYSPSRVKSGSAYNGPASTYQAAGELLVKSKIQTTTSGAMRPQSAIAASRARMKQQKSEEDANSGDLHGDPKQVHRPSTAESKRFLVGQRSSGRGKGFVPSTLVNKNGKEQREALMDLMRRDQRAIADERTQHAIEIYESRGRLAGPSSASSPGGGGGGASPTAPARSIMHKEDITAGIHKWRMYGRQEKQSKS